MEKFRKAGKFWYRAHFDFYLYLCYNINSRKIFGIFIRLYKFLIRLLYNSTYNQEVKKMSDKKPNKTAYILGFIAK